MATGPRDIDLTIDVTDPSTPIPVTAPPKDVDLAIDVTDAGTQYAIGTSPRNTNLTIDTTDPGAPVSVNFPSKDVNMTVGPAPLNISVLDDLTDVTLLNPAEGQGIVWRTDEWVNELISGGGGETDHGALTGLADDDHPQYLEPVEVLAGANMNVDTTTTPGSVIVNAQGIVTGGMLQSEWIWHNTASAGGLASGRAATNTDDVTLATTFYIHKEDVPDRVDWSYHIQDFVAGWVIYAQARSDATSWHRWNVTGAPTLVVDNWHIPVTTLGGSPQGTEPGNNDNILVGFESPHSLSHAGLEDLGADDHTQYHTDARGDARYDTIGTASGIMSTHEAAGDPHTLYQLESEKGIANGYASLDAGGVVPTSQIPSLAINETFTVADEAAMLALVAQIGDMAIRQDTAETFVLSADPASTLSNWKEIYASGQILSVNGYTGVVSLNAADVGADPSGTVTTKIANHAVASDPHIEYQKESEKSAANGYASLDAGTLVPIAEIPTGSSNTTVSLGDHNHDAAYDTNGAAASAVAVHEGLLDPHTQYVTDAEHAAIDHTGITGVGGGGGAAYFGATEPDPTSYQFWAVA